MTPWQRRVALDGTGNFRDIGDYRTADGSRIRRGLVFRAGSLDELTDADVPLLRSLGVRAVVDLRREPERAEVPPPWFAKCGIALTHLQIGSSVAHLRGMAARMLAGEITDFAPDDMVEVYTTLLDHYAEEFGTVIRIIARAERATVVHCTAGKDRTGVVIALLLSFLGVDDETVAADYALSQQYYSAQLVAVLASRFDDLDVDFDRVRSFFEAAPEVMLGFLRELRNRYGSAENYLAGPAGVPPEDLTRVAERLIDTPPGAQISRTKGVA